MRHRWKAAAAVFLLCTLMGCDLIDRPPTDTQPVRFESVWVRHRKDKYDREASALIGFSLRDAQGRPVAAAGTLKVELKWTAASHVRIAKGETEVRARDFHRANSKPVAEGTWYAEPWGIYLLGGDYPGPSKSGYQVSLRFTTADRKTLMWGQRLSVSR